MIHRTVTSDSNALRCFVWLCCVVNIASCGSLASCRDAGHGRARWREPAPRQRGLPAVPSRTRSEKGTCLHLAYHVESGPRSIDTHDHVVLFFHLRRPKAVGGSAFCILPNYNEPDNPRALINQIYIRNKMLPELGVCRDCPLLVNR